LGGDLPWVVRGRTTLRGGQMWLCWLSKPSEFHSNLDTFVCSSTDNHHLFSRFPHRRTSPPVFPSRSFRGGPRPPPTYYCFRIYAFPIGPRPAKSVLVLLYHTLHLVYTLTFVHPSPESSPECSPDVVSQTQKKKDTTIRNNTQYTVWLPIKRCRRTRCGPGKEL